MFEKSKGERWPLNNKLIQIFLTLRTAGVLIGTPNDPKHKSDPITANQPHIISFIDYENFLFCSSCHGDTDRQQIKTNGKTGATYCSSYEF
jgi:hypothetical protein